MHHSVQFTAVATGHEPLRESRESSAVDVVLAACGVCKVVHEYTAARIKAPVESLSTQQAAIEVRVNVADMYRNCV